MYGGKEADVYSFKSERHNVFTGKVNKNVFGSNGDKMIPSIDSIKTYAYGTNKDLVILKEEIKCNRLIKQYKID